jgi:hypothetical protein
MSFTQRKPGIRSVLTQRGDTLRKVAARELGNAARWVELITLNNLKPPYIVDLRADLAEGVILSGNPINVPAPMPRATVRTDPDGIFLKDLDLTNGLLHAEAGGLVPINGLANFEQALLIRVKTMKKELVFHPTYGCYVKRLLGRKASATANLLGAFFVASALQEDERVDRVVNTTAETDGNTIRINSEIMPINNRIINITTVVGQ